jgi:hypothetical protein
MGNKRFEIQEFTEDIDLVKDFISKTQANSDGNTDQPEDV